uniref:PINc domain-containing protein n=1 Tax=Steinernema glaseri TaxID=37863 RepID=A0A1I8ATU0_9BILA
MSEGSADAEAAKSRKRPEIQIYRPGMMRKGTDITLTAKPTPAPPSRNQPPGEHRKKRQDGGPSRGGRSQKNENNASLSSLSEVRSLSGSTTGFETASYRQQKKNRRSGGGTPQSGQQSASSSRQGSIADLSETQSLRNRGPRAAPPSGGGGGRRKQHHNSSQSLYDRPPTFNMARSEHYPVYPETQSLRRDQPRIRSQRGPNFTSNAHDYYNAPRAPPRLSDNLNPAGRPSGRRRLNSTRSIQSERPAAKNDSASNYGGHDFDETQSYCGEPFASCDDLLSQAGSVSSVAASVLSIESILKEHTASFDWTEELAKHEEEQAKERKLQEEMANESNEAAGPMSPRQRGIISIKPAAMSSVASEPHNKRNQKRRGRRNRNDSPSISSVSESIQENPSEDEGCRTPTYEQQESNGRRGIISNGTQLYSADRYSPIPSRAKPGAEADLMWRGGNAKVADRREQPRGRPTLNRGTSQSSEPSTPRPNQLDTVTFNIKSPQRQTQKHNDPKAKPPTPDNARVRSVKSPTSSATEQEIAQKYSADMKKYLEQIEGLCENVSTGDVSSGKILNDVSAKLAKIYFDVFLLDINYTYVKKTDTFMWKQCFYGPIEALRTASNTTKKCGKEFRNILIDFVDNSLKFYENLLHTIEEKVQFKIIDYLYWPNGVPSEDMLSCAVVNGGAKTSANKDIKLALVLIHRQMISIGDLHRYKAMIRGNKDYSSCRLWYSKSAQLYPSNGRCYNQLALIAMYAHRYLDTVFFYARAISAKYAIETARHPLDAAFNEQHLRVDTYKNDVNERLGSGSTQITTTVERNDEIWILPDNGAKSTRLSEVDSEKSDYFANEPVTSLYKWAIAYTLHAAGLIATKIGMERYENVSERAVCLLRALLDRAQCPLTALQLVQIASIFIYCVHVNALKKAPEDGTCSAQQQVAVQMILTFWSLLMEPIIKNLDSLEGYLKGEPVDPKVSRVIPALSTISAWMSTPFVKDVYAGMPSLESFHTPLVKVETWQVFAKLANELSRLVASGVMGLQSTSQSPRTGDAIEVVLPETIFMSSFCNVFPSEPQSVCLVKTNCSVLENADSSLLSLHARFSNILSAAEFLDGSELRCFQFDSKSQSFVCPGEFSEEEDDPVTPRKNSVVEPPVIDHSSPTVVTENQVISELERKKRENKLREQMRAADSTKPTLEVRPEYLVPDTNTFIDHLASLKKIIESKRFTTLVPTTVIAELTGLSQPAANLLANTKPGHMGATDIDHIDWVSEQARLAVQYLRNVSESRTPGIYTITSNGNRQPSLNFVTEELPRSDDKKAVNDDRILSCCVQFEAKMSSSTEPAEGTLKRRVVLLTEDRALKIKAITMQVPCRTIPNFVEWSRLT